MTSYVSWFTVLLLCELTILMFLSVVETIDGLLLCEYCSGYFQVFNNMSFVHRTFIEHWETAITWNFQALTGRPFPTVPSANWESNNYLYQICHFSPLSKSLPNRTQQTILWLICAKYESSLDFPSPASKLLYSFNVKLKTLLTSAK